MSFFSCLTSNLTVLQEILLARRQTYRQMEENSMKTWRWRWNSRNEERLGYTQPLSYISRIRILSNGNLKTIFWWKVSYSLKSKGRQTQDGSRAYICKSDKKINMEKMGREISKIQPQSKNRLAGRTNHPASTLAHFFNI